MRCGDRRGRSFRNATALLIVAALGGCGDDDGSTTLDAAPLVRADAAAGGVDASAGGAPDAGTPPGPDGGAGGVDLAGTWISHVTTGGTITVPLIANQPATIDIVLRILVLRSGSDLDLKLEFCRLDTATTGGSLIVDFPVPVLALMTDRRTIPAPDISVGGAVPLPEFSIRVGQDGAANPRDDDGDGHPGVTIPTILLGTSLQAYSGLAVTLSFAGVMLTAPDTQMGTSAFTTAGRVFDTVPLNQMGPIEVTPSASPTFTATRLAGDVPCATVAGMFP